MLSTSVSIFYVLIHKILPTNLEEGITIIPIFTNEEISVAAEQKDYGFGFADRCPQVCTAALPGNSCVTLGK